MFALWRRFQLWFYTWCYIAAVVMACGLRRRRMTHNNGIIGRGRLRVVENPQFPAHDLFPSGKEYPCRVRHATVPYVDDGVRAVRSGSVKFADSRWKTPLDLLMNSGRITFFWTAYHFLQSAWMRREKGGFAFLEYFKLHEGAGRAAREGFRRYPPSFNAMYYNTQTPLAFHARDGKPRYVKFRLIPGDRGPDTGIPDPATMVTPEQLSDFRSDPADARGRNYLKDEYKARVAAGPVRYVLQMQLHDVCPDDKPEILNSNRFWDEATHPWLDVAHIEVTEVLSYREAVLTAYSVANLPPSLGILPARSIHDFNSINYMRSREWPAVWMRKFMIAVFGLPEEYAGDGPRNYRPPGM
jgi:arachidonate 5-lipoxygenase